MTRAPLASSHDEEKVPTQVSQCLNPACLQLNQGEGELCQVCGEPLLLGGRYRALHFLDVGGFAYTFAAIDEHCLGTRCVIKQFVPRQLSDTVKAKAIGLFHQEAAILKEIGNHPQIPTLLAFLAQQERWYLVQEFIAGQNLAQKLAQVNNFSQQQVQQMLVRLLPVLQFIHERQIIHRDLKPSNIILLEDGNLALIDFGSCLRLSQEYLTPVSSISITPEYASPEQVQGKVCPASDLYSLGITAIELLTGNLPSVDTLPKLIEPKMGVNSELADILIKLVEPEVSDRYQSAAEVLEALSALPQLQPKEANQVGEANVSPLALINLSSQPNEDYQQLENWLALGKYLEADRETWRILLQMAGREQKGSLTGLDWEYLSLSTLNQIDDLWQKYSDRRFGLKVQKQIYQSLVNEAGFKEVESYLKLSGQITFDYQLWQKFGELVGWYQQQKWLNYAELDFTLCAPVGHLPVCCIDVFNRAGVDRGICGWWRLGFLTLMQKLSKCNTD